MKVRFSALLVSCAIAAPFSAFAQSATANDAPLTRAQVQADLVRLEKAGYQPFVGDNDYPANIQRAEAIVTKQDAQPGNGQVTSAAIETGAGTGISTGNQPTNPANGHSLYAGS
ncbi:hypothetical protein PCA20602_04619 [Pandoraea capi]|uniref:DUF4148 domain-containing protein n=1 Tax=Pandoraea capi TaxID=2508286 RepID=A0ABY6WB50_9BURK|nr:DUF4148 domain-containing protein [Pandoraea capi]VVE49619.1 hypothetical protein PCA20602_04619 [Pandoraea capi]